MTPRSSLVAVLAAFVWSCAPAAASTGELDEPGLSAHWAEVLAPEVARHNPAEDSSAVTRLKLRTEDGTPELVRIVDTTTDKRGIRWVRVHLPIRPNGTLGWVRRSALGGFHETKSWLLIDRRRLRAVLIRGGRVAFSAPIGIGLPKWPTPAGEFYIRNRLSGYGLGTIYGPLAFGTSAKSAVLTDWPGGGVIGIHGTNKPELLPGRVSHGCIRMKNRDILRLDRLMGVGTPLTIR